MVVNLVTWWKLSIISVDAHHHEVELAVGEADGLEDEGDPPKLTTGHPRERGRNSDSDHTEKRKNI